MEGRKEELSHGEGVDALYGQVHQAGGRFEPPRTAALAACCLAVCLWGACITSMSMPMSTASVNTMELGIAGEGQAEATLARHGPVASGL